MHCEHEIARCPSLELELKARIAERGLDASGAVEKIDLIVLLRAPLLHKRTAEGEANRKAAKKARKRRKRAADAAGDDVGGAQPAPATAASGMVPRALLQAVLKRLARETRIAKERGMQQARKAIKDSRRSK